MTVSTHWIYLDEQNRVTGYVTQSKPIDRSFEGAIPLEFSQSKKIEHALYNPESNTLIFDADYEAFHVAQEAAKNSEGE